VGLTTRRKFLFGALGILGIGGVTAWLEKNAILRWMVLRTRNDGIKLTAAPNLMEGICLLTSSQLEGPFFIASPIRRDIKEDRKGKDFTLKMQLVRMPECLPVTGAVVEIWHCDAEGNYSGYPGDLAHNLWGTLRFLGLSGEHIEPVNETRFLRGAQVSDDSGQVEFNTIFPGWYEPRAPHIHFKIVVDKQEQLTSQLYFEPEFCRRIYLNEKPYDQYGDSLYTPENDVVFGQSPEAEGLLLKPIWNDNLPLEASVKVGIRRSV
jgi:protocatechuate 3,4-dioxygenase beta subunit